MPKCTYISHLNVLRRRLYKASWSAAECGVISGAGGAAGRAAEWCSGYLLIVLCITTPCDELIIAHPTGLQSSVPTLHTSMHTLITQQPAYSLTEQNRNPHQEQEREEGRGVSVEPLWLSDTVYKSISCRRWTRATVSRCRHSTAEKLLLNDKHGFSNAGTDFRSPSTSLPTDTYN